MLELLAITAILFAWQAGYWVGRRQRPHDTWDWRWHAVRQCGFVHRLHLEKPAEFNEIGQRYDDLRDYLDQ
jgi:hypothetical protein